MLGEAGFMTGLPKDVLNPMIDLVKEVEPDTAEFCCFRSEAAMRENTHEKNKNCLYILRSWMFI